MEHNTFAVLIGINQYQDEQLPALKWSEKDCHDLAAILTHPDHGMFRPENVLQVTGQDATLENIQQKLFTHIVRDRARLDTVLVYLSGHAFPIPYQNRVYFAAYDTHIETVKQNPLKGLWMHQLHDEFFKKSDAKNLIFILDTCYSGSLIPPATKGALGPKLVDETFYASGSGRIAIVSSPPHGLSREDDRYRNSVFSHFLIRGLAGEAVDEHTGEVTIDDLLTYLRRAVPPDQPTGRYGQDYGRIVLTKGFTIHKDPRYAKSYPEYETSKDELYKTSFTPLRNSLEPYQAIIHSLVSLLSDKAQVKQDVDTHILDAIRQSVSAKAAFLLRKDQNDWRIKSLSLVPESLTNHLDDYVSTALSASLRNNALGPEINGVEGKITVRDAELNLCTISLNKPFPCEILVVCEAQDDLAKSDIFAEIVLGIYSSSHSFSSMPAPLSLEAAIHDNLRRRYQFVPRLFYDRRFKLFTNRLHAANVSVIFQPILRLGVKGASICGFESLAYDTDLEGSPADIFRAAELWGKKFTLETDLHFLQLSLNKYRQLRMDTSGYRRPEDIQDLSINVYPESLLRTKYFNTLKKLVVADGLIPNDKLILEISEKSIFPVVENEGIAVDTDITSFRQVLEKYVHAVGIGFAIDDFGVGYSSVSRLAELHPSYLKIDREILLLSDAYDTIKFIVSFVNDLTSRKFLRNAKIVLEGYDDETARTVHLGQLMKIGIQYIQGYIIGKPLHNKLARLDLPTKDYLNSLMNIPIGVRNGE